MRKPAFCICENKDADQLRGHREADQRLCFRYMDSTIPLLPKPEISSFYPSSVAAQPGLCQTWSETPKTGFLTTWLIWFHWVLRNMICQLSPNTFRIWSLVWFIIRAASGENLSLGFLTRTDTNRAVQPQKMATGLKFWI